MGRYHPRRLLRRDRPQHLPRIRRRRVGQEGDQPVVQARGTHLLHSMRTPMGLRVSTPSPSILSTPKSITTRSPNTLSLIARTLSDLLSLTLKYLRNTRVL